MIRFRDYRNLVVEDAREELLQSLEKEIDAIFDGIKKHVADMTVPRRGWLDKVRQWWWDLRYGANSPQHPLTRLADLPKGTNTGWQPPAETPKTETFYVRLVDYKEVTDLFDDMEMALNEQTMAHVDQMIDFYKDKLKNTVKNFVNRSPQQLSVNDILALTNREKSAIGTKPKAEYPGVNIHKGMGQFPPESDFPPETVQPNIRKGYSEFPPESDFPPEKAQSNINQGEPQFPPEEEDEFDNVHEPQIAPKEPVPEEPTSNDPEEPVNTIPVQPVTKEPIHVSKGRKEIYNYLVYNRHKNKHLNDQEIETIKELVSAVIPKIKAKTKSYEKLNSPIWEKYKSGNIDADTPEDIRRFTKWKNNFNWVLQNLENIELNKGNIPRDLNTKDFADKFNALAIVGKTNSGLNNIDPDTGEKIKREKRKTTQEIPQEKPMPPEEVVAANEPVEPDPTTAAPEMPPPEEPVNNGPEHGPEPAAPATVAPEPAPEVKPEPVPEPEPIQEPKIDMPHGYPTKPNSDEPDVSSPLWKKEIDHWIKMGEDNPNVDTTKLSPLDLAVWAGINKDHAKKGHKTDMYGTEDIQDLRDKTKKDYLRELARADEPKAPRLAPVDGAGHPHETVSYFKKLLRENKRPKIVRGKTIDSLIQGYKKALRN